MPQSLKQQAVSGIKWSAVESITLQVVHFAVSLVLARLLEPSDFGLVGMVGVFVGISGVFVDSGFSQALIRKLDRTESDNATVFYFNIIIGLLIYVMLFFAAPLIAKFYKEPQLTSITRWVSLMIPLASLGIVQKALLTICVDFKTQTMATIPGALISAIVGIFLAWKGYGVWALVIQQLAGRVSFVILIWTLSKWHPQARFSWQSFKNLFGFGSKLLGSGLLNTFYGNMYNLVIGKVYSASDLGYYSQASHFAGLPSGSLTGILQRVVYPILCKVQNEKARLAKIYRDFIKLTVFIVFPLMTGLAAVSHSTIVVLIGEKWAFAGDLLMYMCFAQMWYPVHAINLNPIQAIGRSDIFLKIEIIKKLIGVAILFATVHFGLVVMVIGGIVNSLLCLYVNTYYTDSLINVSLWTQMKDIAPTFILSMSMFTLIMVFNQFVDNVYVELVGGICLGAVFYIGCAYLFRFKELQELIRIITKQDFNHE